MLILLMERPQQSNLLPCLKERVALFMMILPFQGTLLVQVKEKHYSPEGSPHISCSPYLSKEKGEEHASPKKREEEVIDFNIVPDQSL